MEMEISDHPDSQVSSKDDPLVLANNLNNQLKDRIWTVINEWLPEFMAEHASSEIPAYLASAERVISGDMDAFLRILLHENEAGLRVIFRSFDLPIGLRGMLLRQILLEVRGWTRGKYPFRDVLILAELSNNALPEASLQHRTFKIYQKYWKEVVNAKVLVGEAGQMDAAALAAAAVPWISLGVHECVVACMLVEAPSNEDQAPCLLLEDCSGLDLGQCCVVTLRDMLLRQDGRLSSPFTMANALVRISQGMAYAHTSNCIHGNLSAESIVVLPTSGRDFDLTFKITDFGIPAARSLSCLPGSSSLSDESTQLSRQLASDIFSLGLLLLDIIRGRLLSENDYMLWFRGRHIDFEDANHNLITVSLQASILPQSMLRNLRPVLALCLCASNWYERPSAEEISAQIQLVCLTVYTGLPQRPPVDLRKLIFASGNACNLAVAEFRVDGVFSAMSESWLSRIESGFPSSVTEIINYLLIQWRRNLVTPDRFKSILMFLLKASTGNGANQSFHSWKLNHDSYAVNPVFDHDEAESEFIRSVLECSLAEGGFCNASLPIVRTTTRVSILEADMAHSNVILFQICPSSPAKCFTVGIIVGDVISGILRRSSSQADCKPELQLLEPCVDASSPSDSQTSDNSVSSSPHRAIHFGAKAGSLNIWWCRDVGNDNIVCTPDYLGMQGQFLFTIGQFLIAFSQTIYIHVVVGIEFLPRFWNGLSTPIDFVLVFEGNNSESAHGGMGEQCGVADCDDARSDFGEEYGHTNHESSPSVDSDPGIAEADPQYNLHNMYQPEYYVCSGQVSSDGGSLEILRLQRLTGIAVDQRVVLMHILVPQRDIVLAGAGGLLGSVRMLSPLAQQGCSTTPFNYLCGDIRELLKDPTPAEPHKFDSTIVAMASHPEAGLLVVGDTAGTVSTWRWSSIGGDSSDYSLICHTSVQTSVENIFISPCGTVLCVAVSRRLYLLAFSHAMRAVCPDFRVGYGSLYIRGILDSEPNWAVSTKYQCSFMDPGNLGLTANMISIWKCSVADDAPSELRVMHWLHPNVGYAESNHVCSFRDCPIDTVSNLESALSTQEVMCMKVSEMLRLGHLIPALTEVSFFRNRIYSAQMSSYLTTAFSNPVLCQFLDVVRAIQLIAADELILRLRDMKCMTMVPVRSLNESDDMKIQGYQQNVVDFSQKQALREAWFLSRILPGASSFFIGESDQFLCQTNIISLGSRVAALLYKSDGLINGVKYAVRLFDVHGAKPVSHHSFCPSLRRKMDMFLYDNDFFLHSDVTALALTNSGTHLCCAFSSRLSSANQSVLYVYSCESWCVTYCINVSIIEPITYLQWGYLDFLVIASSAAPGTSKFPGGAQNREVGTIGDRVDSDDESEDDDCRSVLHRLGHMIFARKRYKRNLRSEPPSPSENVRSITAESLDEIAVFDSGQSILLFVDWPWRAEDENLHDSGVDRHFSDEEILQSVPSCGSGHDTPVACHSTPLKAIVFPTLSGAYGGGYSPTDYEYNSPVDVLYPSPVCRPYERGSEYCSASGERFNNDNGSNNSGDILEFDVLIDKYVPFVARRNATEFISSDLTIKQRKGIIDDTVSVDILDCVKNTQELVQNDNLISLFVLNVAQWLEIAAEGMASGVYVVNVPSSSSDNHSESSTLSVFAVSDAFLHRKLSAYIHLGPPFCWAHSFSRSYNVVMFVAHQLASRFGNDYVTCVVSGLWKQGKRIIDQHLSSSCNPNLLEMADTFRRSLKDGLFGLHHRLLYLEFVLCNSEKEGMATNLRQSPHDMMPRDGYIPKLPTSSVSELRKELEILSSLQKSIQVVDITSMSRLDDVTFNKVFEFEELSNLNYIAVPTLSTLSLGFIYDIYVGDPLLHLSLNASTEASNQPIIDVRECLDIVVQIEVGVLSNILTDECSSSSGTSSTASWSSLVSGSLVLEDATPMNIRKNEILRIDTTEECESVYVCETSSIDPVCSDRDHDTQSVDVELFGQAADSVAQTTTFLLQKLSELCRKAVGVRIIVFSNMDSDSPTEISERFPALCNVIRQVCVARFNLKQQPQDFNLQTCCFNILKQKGKLGLSIKRGQTVYPIVAVAKFLAEKICHQSVDYVFYLWHHFARHCGAVGKDPNEIDVVLAIDSRSFDSNYFSSMMSRMQLLAGPAYSKKRWFAGIKPVLEVLCAALMPPPLTLISSALDMDPLEVWSVLFFFLPGTFFVDTTCPDLVLSPSHPRFLSWLTHPERVNELYYIDAANGHNYLCTLYLRHCGNKSIAVDHQWQDYLRAHGPVHLRLTSRGLIELTGHIRKIDETCGIKGILPHQIGFISGLKELYARRVGLYGTLPFELGLLKQLRVLSMGNNHLHGPLPKTLGGLRRLQRIVLHQNRLSGDVPQELNLLQCIVNLAGNPNLHHGPDVPEIERSALCDLYAATNGEGWVCKSGWCGSAATSNWYKVGVLGSHVHSIVMSSNNMVGSLPPTIAHLRQLRMVELATMPGLGGTLSKQFCELVNLRRLCICRCAIRGSIPDEIGQLIQLEELQLFGNNMTGSIPDSIRYLVNLRLLSLGEYTGGNNFAPAQLPICFSSLRNLEALFIANCNIVGPIPSWIGHLTELRQLDLQRNNITGTLPEAVSSLTNLLYLNVKDNIELGGSLPIGALSQLTKLNRLSLVHCSFVDAADSTVLLQGRLPRCRIWI